MPEGTMTTVLPLSDTLDELVGNADVGGAPQTARQLFSKLSAQLAATGPLAEVINGAIGNVSRLLLPYVGKQGAIVLLGTGQSNMVGAAADAGGDTTPNANVKIWNGSALVMAQMGATPLATSNNNLLFHAGKYLQSVTGLPVYLILAASGGQPIDRWISTDATPTLWTSITSQVPAALAAAGLSYVDRVLWHQGEADSATMGPIRYRDKLIAVKEQMRAQSWWLDGHTGFIAGELVDKPAESGPTGGERSQNTGLHLASQTDLDIGLVPLRDLPASADRLHYSGASLVKAGQRYGRAAMMPTPALPRLTRTNVVGDGLFLSVATSGGDFSDLGDLFEFLSTLSVYPRARVQTTIAAGQWRLPVYGSFPVGWAYGQNFEFYGVVSGGYAMPVKADWGGTKATDLAMLRGKFLTELIAMSQGFIVRGNGGYWNRFLLSGDNVSGAANHGVRFTEPQIPGVGGGSLRLQEFAVHGFDNASAAAFYVDAPMSWLQTINCFASHCGIGVYANNSHVDAANMVMGYIAGSKNTAAYNSTIMALGQTHQGGAGVAFVASRNGAINATGADNTGSVSTGTGGTVWTA